MRTRHKRRRRSFAFRTTRPKAEPEARAWSAKETPHTTVVVEGLYSIRGDVAPLREIVDVCPGHRRKLLVDERTSLGTYG